ncbi:MAG: hypothetical protein M3445_00765 [Actinomycetota bacterium]|nr:hypothetical protein [Actinomycetota bacterium]
MTETWPFETRSSSVEEALDHIPDDATSVQIRDQGAAEQRLGIDDLETGASGTPSATAEGCCRRFPASTADETSTRRPHVDG